MKRLFLTHRFKSAQKRYQRGQLSQGDFISAVNALNYRDGSGRYYQLDYQGQWLCFDNYSRRWFLADRPAGKSRSVKKPVWITVACLILVFTLLIGLPASRAWMMSLFTAGISQNQGSDWEMPKVILEPALEKVLCPGVTLKAPAGALSGDESFDAYEIPVDTAWKLAEQAGLYLPLLHAFEFDAGLTEEQSFAQAVSIEIDLDQAGIPEELRHDLAVCRIGENGVQLLQSQVEGSKLTLSTRKNSVIVTVSLLSALYAVTGVLVNQSNAQKFGSSQYIAYRIPDHKYRLYTIYWPDSHPYSQPRDSSKRAVIQKDIDEILRETGLVWSEGTGILRYKGGDRAAAIAMSKAYQLDAYKRLQKQTQDIDFLLRYVYPEKVAIVVEYLMRAHDYLFDERQFRSLSQGVDIVLRDPWPAEIHGNVSGICEDQAATFPYILINLPDVLTDQQLEDELKPFIDKGADASWIKKRRSSSLAERNGKLDALQGTLVHELFHVVQEEYHNNILYEYTHFSEATALLVESEAVRHYQKKRWLHLDAYAFSPSDLYELLETEWGNDSDNVGPDGNETARKHGYTFYQVLAYNRDKNASWKRRPDSFLPALMENFQSYSASLSLRNLAQYDLMKQYAYSDAAAITLRAAERLFNKNRNILTLNPSHSFLTVKDHVYQPYSVKAYRLQVDWKKTAAVILRPAASDFKKPDWLGLAISTDPLDAKMHFTDVPVDNRLFVLPAEDACLLISQDLSNQGLSAATGYEMEAYLAQQPVQPSVDYDTVAGSFVFRLPERSVTAGDSYAGRLIEIRSSHQDIKPYKKIVPAGTNVIRIPIESIIYGDDDKISVIEQLLARGMLFSLRSTMKVAARIPIEGLRVTESGGLFTFTKSGEDSDDPDEESDYINRSFSMSMDAKDGIFTVGILTDKDYYMMIRLQVGALLDYLKYAKPLFGRIDARYVKELDKYESTFTVTICDVYSTESAVNPEQVVPYDQVLKKSVRTVSGPASEPMDFEGKTPEISEGIMPGTYTGNLFVSFDTNLDMQVPGSISVVVKSDQTVSIRFVGETLYGALGATDKVGQYQFFERIKTASGYTYQPVQGAYALASEDGTLVFSFIPAKLKRRS